MSTTTAIAATAVETVSQEPKEFIPSGDTTSTLTFYSHSPSGDRPYNYVVKPPEGVPTSNYETVQHQVPIHDVRAASETLSLDTNAFSLHTIPTSLSGADFLDENKINTTYYSETKKLLQSVIGPVEDIIIFDHTLRGPTRERKPVDRVHIDQTTKSGLNRARRHLSPERYEEVVGKNTRIRIINVWRPLNGPVVEHPLAFADSDTVKEEDVVSIRHIYDDWEGETAGVKYGKGQKWWYVSGQRNEEVALIECFDSEVGEGGRRRRVPHTAFVHPDSVPGARERQSIEIRCLIIG